MVNKTLTTYVQAGSEPALHDHTPLTLVQALPTSPAPPCPLGRGSGATEQRRNGKTEAELPGPAQPPVTAQDPWGAPGCGFPERHPCGHHRAEPAGWLWSLRKPRKWKPRDQPLRCSRLAPPCNPGSLERTTQAGPSHCPKARPSTSCLLWTLPGSPPGLPSWVVIIPGFLQK